MKQIKRIIFTPTAENFQKIEHVKDALNISYSDLINGMFNLVTEEKIKQLSKEDIRNSQNNIFKSIMQ